MALDKQPHDLTALPIGIAEFSFAEDATTPANAQTAGFDDFNNLTAFSIQSKADKKEHKGSYRNGKRTDKTSVTNLTSGYQVKADEINARKMRMYFYATQGSNLTQTACSAVAADAIASPVKGKWYDILIGGVRIREITTLAASAGVEDTDWVADYKTGRIRSLTATGFGTLTVTAPAILATDPTSLMQLTPLNKSRVTGIGRMLIFDSETGALVLEHRDFGCEITPSGNVDGGGDKESEMTFDINITSPVGTIGMWNK